MHPTRRTWHAVGGRRSLRARCYSSMWLCGAVGTGEIIRAIGQSHHQARMHEPALGSIPCCPKMQSLCMCMCTCTTLVEFGLAGQLCVCARVCTRALQACIHAGGLRSVVGLSPDARLRCSACRLGGRLVRSTRGPASERVSTRSRPRCPRHAGGGSFRGVPGLRSAPSASQRGSSSSSRVRQVSAARLATHALPTSHTVALPTCRVALQCNWRS